RPASDAQRGIDVRALHLHGEHRRVLAFVRVLVVALRNFHLLGPDRLRGGGTELLAHDAGRGHGPRQAAPLVVHRRPDADRLLADSHLLLLVDLLDGAGGADLTTEHARELAVADARNEDRRPQPLEAGLEERGVQRVVRAHLHALRAADAALQELALFHGARGANHLLAVGAIGPVRDAHRGERHRAGGSRRNHRSPLQIRLLDRAPQVRQKAELDHVLRAGSLAVQAQVALVLAMLDAALRTVGALAVDEADVAVGAFFVALLHTEQG